MKYILSIDQGTTSTRAIIFDVNGHQVASSQREFKQFYPNDGWVEHCPQEILESCLETTQQCLNQAGLSADSLEAIGITNQRETVLVWDKHTGKPIYPAIVWQDRRTSNRCKDLHAEGCETIVQEKTGLLLDPYFSATKIAWIIDHVDGARKKAESGELIAGTIDSWLIWHLTNGTQHRTDATNASRTSLYNIHANQWDSELCEMFRVPMAMLPEVCDSAFYFGDACVGAFENSPTAITGVAGDQQAALVGQCAFKPGALKSTYGTGCFVLANTGTIALSSKHRLLTTIAYRLNGITHYGIEGSIFIAGAAVQWLRDELNFISDAGDTEAILNSTPLHHGVVVVPAFTGLGAPHWSADSRGAVFGLKRNSGRNEIISATLQSIALQTDDLLQAMNDDGLTITEFKVDGGMTRNGAFCQMLANFIGKPVHVPSNIETTAVGAAYLACLGAGIYDSLDEVSSHWELASLYEPKSDSDIPPIKSQWQRCVKATIEL